MVIAEHTSIKNEHYTPPIIVNAARVLMDGIELDPASDAAGNEVIRAAKYYTAEDDGLAQEWKARSVFLNPPGGRLSNNKSSLTAWWDKLYYHWLNGDVEEAVFVGFNLQLLCKRGSDILPLPLCIPQPNSCEAVNGMGRVKYFENKNGLLTEQKQPPHGSFFVYLPPNIQGRNTLMTYKKFQFRSIFQEIGEVKL